jgi:hypothetical protein
MQNGPSRTNTAGEGHQGHCQRLEFLVFCGIGDETAINKPVAIIMMDTIYA